MSELQKLQADFLEAVFDQQNKTILAEIDESDTKITAEQRLSIYRNNAFLTTIEFLEDKYPAFKAMVGEEFFNQACKAYMIQYPPNAGDLTDYGGAFPAFVRTIPGLDTYPYLFDLVMFEWLQIEVFCSIDTTNTVESVQELIEFGEEKLAQAKAKFKNHIRLFTSDWPIDDIWALHQGKEEFEIKQGNFQFLLYQKGEEVIFARIAKDLYCFIVSLREGGTLLEAAQKATDENEEFDFFAALQTIVSFELICEFYS